MTFVISPHIDDAVFSLGLLIREYSKIGNRVTIINCFSITNFTLNRRDLGVQFVTCLRKSEDRKLARRMRNLELINLDFEDAPLRGETIRQEFPLSSKNRNLAISIEEEIYRIIPEASSIFFPLSIGNHIDHLICLEVAVRFAQCGKYDINFYEDLPYVAKNPCSALDSKVMFVESKTGKRLVDSLFKVQNCESKLRLVRYYSSQLTVEIMLLILHYTLAMGGERLWRLQNVNWKCYSSPRERSCCSALSS